MGHVINPATGRAGGGADTIVVPSYNGNLGTGSGEFSDLPNANQYPAAAVSLEVVSANAADAAAGTGCRKVKIVGLNASWVETTVEVTLNGTTPVAVTGTWLRVNAMYASEVGSGGKAAGNVDVRNVSGGAVFARLTAVNRSAVGSYTVPEGKRAFLTSLTVGSGILTRFILSATCDWRTRALVTGVFVAQVEAVALSAGLVQFPSGLWFPARCDIKINAATLSAGPTFGAATMVLAQVGA